MNALEKLRSDLKRIPPVPSDVVALLQEIVLNPELPCANLVFITAWFSLSDDYVPFLIQIVMSERHAFWHEQAVELLGEFSDSKSIPALKKALAYRWDFDESLDIPKKALRSLFAIGTEDALAIIKNELHSDAMEIRQEAADLTE